MCVDDVLLALHILGVSFGPGGGVVVGVIHAVVEICVIHTGVVGEWDVL
jgi:hypothetical protein